MADGRTDGRITAVLNAPYGGRPITRIELFVRLKQFRVNFVSTLNPKKNNNNNNKASKFCGKIFISFEISTIH